MLLGRNRSDVVPHLVDAQISVAELRARVDQMAARNARDARDADNTLRARAARRLGRPPRARDASEVVKGVEARLDAADRATRAMSAANVSWWARHWHGVLTEQAYENYHAARVLAVTLYDGSDIAAELPTAIDKARRYLASDHSALIAAEHIADTTSLPRQRAALQHLVRENYEASDAQQRRLRRFRNIVLVGTVGTIGLVLATTTVLALHPGWVSFCFHAQVHVAGHGGGPGLAGTELVRTVQKCPTNGQSGAAPQGRDVVIVALMGLLGGSLAAAVSLRTLGGSTTPYDVPVALATLKVPTGALTAMGGLIAIRAGFVPGLSNLDSSPQILAYALLLGYAQQAATGFLDRRVQQLQEKT